MTLLMFSCLLWSIIILFRYHVINQHVAWLFYICECELILQHKWICWPRGRGWLENIKYALCGARVRSKYYPNSSITLSLTSLNESLLGSIDADAGKSVGSKVDWGCESVRSKVDWERERNNAYQSEKYKSKCTTTTTTTHVSRVCIVPRPSRFDLSSEMANQ